MIFVVLPWPPKDLSPNARVHWSKKSAAAKAYRHECGWTVKAAQLALALDAGKHVDPKFSASGPITLDIEFFEPDKRARDIDNMLASIKSGIDGIADALGVNDRRFVYSIRRGEIIGGMVKVRISEEWQPKKHPIGVAA
jgi:crossover junction endodeoxyribonuclease RusA